MSATPQPCPPSAWKKHGIVLAPDASMGEKSYIQNFVHEVVPLPDGRWRLWYSPCDETATQTLAIAEGVPGDWKRVHCVLTPGEPDMSAPFSIGGVPEGWRPTQVVHIHMRDGRHRLFFWILKMFGPQRFVAADSTDGFHYKIINLQKPCLYTVWDWAVEGGWTDRNFTLPKKPKEHCLRPAGEPVAPNDLVTNDATCVYQRPDGIFELYTATLETIPEGDPAYVKHDNLAGSRRVIDRFLSEDGLNFTDRKRVIRPDADDPPDMQFYHLSVTYTPEGRVGMLGRYPCNEQTMDIEWCFSKDGVKWERPKREGWIPLGKPGDPDSLGAYPPASLVQRDGQWYLFYTVCNYLHNGRLPHGGGPSAQIALATTKSIWA